VATAEDTTINAVAVAVALAVAVAVAVAYGFGHTPNFHKIHPHLHRCISIRVHPYAHPQHIKVLKHFVYI
jgi:hypothetical protein